MHMKVALGNQLEANSTNWTKFERVYGFN